MRILLAIFFSTLLAFANPSTNEADEFDVEFDAKANTFDPLSGYNRVMTNVNDFIYSNMLTPAAKGYAYVVPEPARTAISNFFDNLMFPIRFVNNVLQLKFQNAGEETLRFLANTIIGFGGLTDGAKYYGLKEYDEDLGQTLGYWGVGNGFHIVWPILGPSNLRDTAGMVGDYFANPISYVKPRELSIGIGAFKYLNDFSHDPTAYDKLKKDAIDLYPFLRDGYEQRREHLIKE
ncbi:VacJ family lipoprotein [Campylobacter curvus]|uniref:Lipid asymmetry ABC transporter MlaABCDEF, lipoprotein MlaA n=5 Tax=Campylobacter TaxID=194 RepID=A7H0J6_CAMC5|nr:VacJ family lipoprotein [Campylobacter curvus]EAU01463.1 lipid asymmetry ABC transporter MlaABCDEF, lipoprotein MlaA [Campylobacter curvus 525.92]